ncbi:hypothetical protein [Planctomycetes bacterium TBK1r]|uniref:PDZ domain-containing protein n=1 Tax=Stieleria magnilauensis TaxID=2527963 RepID=A0ABX5XS80_9BACT|nr:hypothetical protein TBK1r_38070 [Planctomycetes bacterium TBK1r]
MMPGDVIVSLGDREIDSADAFRQAVRESDLSAGLRMQVYRDGVRRLVFIKKK